MGCYVPAGTDVSRCCSDPVVQTSNLQEKKNLQSDKAETNATVSTLCIKHEESLRRRFDHHLEREGRQWRAAVSD